MIPILTKSPRFPLPAVLAIFGGALAACFLAFPRDDAFITFRYAERIAEGLGFTYQAGENVIGTSTPLWTLILAMVARLGWPVGVAAAWLGVWFHALAIGILGRTLERVSGRPAAWIGAALLAVNPPSAAIAASGMESGLVECLVTAGLASVVFRRTGWGAVIAALMVLTRVDLLPLSILILTANYLSSPRSIIRNVLIFISIALPWFAWSWATTGSPLPHSIPAKLAFYASRGWSNGHIALGWPVSDPLRAALCFSGLVGAVQLRRSPVACLAAWPVIHLVALGYSGTWIHEWYLTPLYPAVFFFAAVAVCRITSRSDDRGWITVALAIIVLVLGSNRVRAAREDWADATDRLLDCHGAAADFISAHRRTGETVACGDIGLIGYRTRAPILDTVGLVSPSVLPFLADDDPASIYRTLRPDWAVIATYGPDHERVLADPDFVADYAEHARFVFDEDRTYIVFRLVDA